MAYFVIEATNADLTLQEILNLVAGASRRAASSPQAHRQRRRGDNVAKRVEFKAFFTNMSHLWYGEGN